MEVIDEWFRALQERIGAANITRVSPEFYTYKAHKVDLRLSTCKAHEVPEFVDRMMIDEVSGDSVNTLSNGHVVSHVSGNW